MTLRKKIFEVICAAKGDKAKAAIDVCVLLEDELGDLVRNADYELFDDDHVVYDAIYKKRITEKHK
ncbi:hypothetical protein OURE66S_01214 [Oligella ureolytica]